MLTDISFYLFYFSYIWQEVGDDQDQHRMQNLHILNSFQIAPETNLQHARTLADIPMNWSHEGLHFHLQNDSQRQTEQKLGYMQIHLLQYLKKSEHKAYIPNISIFAASHHS